jgi:beta-galactosidase
VEEYGKQNAPEKRPLSLDLKSSIVQTTCWYEQLKPEGECEVLAFWKGRHLEGTPAVTLKRLGKGVVIYVGTYLTGAVMQALIPEIERLSEIQPLWPGLPAGVKVVLRENSERKLWFVINYSDQPALIPAGQKGTDLVTGRSIEGEFTLGAYDVCIVQT